MELKVLEEKDNKLLKRKEIKFSITYPQAPPKRADILNKIAEITKSDIKNIIVKKIRNVFGMRKSIGTACIYETPQDLEKYEPKYLLKRWKIKGEESAKEENKGEERKEKA